MISWFDNVHVGDFCAAESKCPQCEPTGNCDPCNTIDGREADYIAEYASTCDGCAELCLNETKTIDPETDLGYCPTCTNDMTGLEK